MKKGIRDHFCKVSSDFKPFWQVTIFHTRLPHKPNHGLGLRQGRNSENLQKWVWLALKRFFSWKKAYAIIFAKVSSDFKPFWQVTIFHTRLPHKNEILDWDLDKAEILKTYKMSFDWLKTIFFMKEGIRDHFCKVSSDLKPFLTSYHISHKTSPQNQIMDCGLKQGLNSENLQKWFWLAQNDFFSRKKAYAIIFAKVSSDLKPFWQVTIFHTRLPHKPNHGLGLRQGWNSENLKKWVWMAQNDIFHEKRHTRSFWKVSSDFKQFWQVTIFHTRLPTNQILDWDLDKAEILKT